MAASLGAGDGMLTRLDAICAVTGPLAAETRAEVAADLRAGACILLIASTHDLRDQARWQIELELAPPKGNACDGVGTDELSDLRPLACRLF